MRQNLRPGHILEPRTAAANQANDAWQATGLDADLKTKLRTIADECDTLVNDMEFGFLFHRRKKVMSVGYDVDTQRLEPSSYDLLASESRIASFVAVAKGDVPQDAGSTSAADTLWYRDKRSSYRGRVRCSSI